MVTEQIWTVDVIGIHALGHGGTMGGIADHFVQRIWTWGQQWEELPIILLRSIRTTMTEGHAPMNNGFAEKPIGNLCRNVRLKLSHLEKISLNRRLWTDCMTHNTLQLYNETTDDETKIRKEDITRISSGK